ncbi:hypothetical protein CN977_16935 [Bacillus thuringiensis]|nr:hypothetical protein CN977_16935 [Bacillus thuringiensis]
MNIINDILLKVVFHYLMKTYIFGVKFPPHQELEKKFDLIMTELEKLNAKADISNQEPKRKGFFGIF